MRGTPQVRTAEPSSSQCCWQRELPEQLNYQRFWPGLRRSLPQLQAADRRLRRLCKGSTRLRGLTLYVPARSTSVRKCAIREDEIRRSPDRFQLQVVDARSFAIFSLSGPSPAVFLFANRRVCPYNADHADCFVTAQRYRDRFRPGTRRFVGRRFPHVRLPGRRPDAPHR